MTAVVGILNKQAVAIAADSAVTIGDSDNHKIFNKANIVFTLSKYHPVGIMIYNSASFMSTPWETIIKVYREQLDKKCFPTIKDYQVDFIEFLRSKDFYTNEDIMWLSRHIYRKLSCWVKLYPHFLLCKTICYQNTNKDNQ